MLIVIFPNKLNSTSDLCNADSKLPIIGSTVIILGTDPLIWTVPYINGKFRLEHIAVGRITLQLSYRDYEANTISGIIDE